MINEREKRMVRKRNLTSFFSSLESESESRRTTLERSRGASSWVYVNEAASRSHSFDDSAETPINGMSRQTAKSDTTWKIARLLLEYRFMFGTISATMQSMTRNRIGYR